MNPPTTTPNGFGGVDPSRMIETMMMSQMFGATKGAGTGTSWLGVIQMLLMIMLPDIRAGITWSVTQIRELVVTICSTYVFVAFSEGIAWMCCPGVNSEVTDINTDYIATNSFNYTPCGPTTQPICVTNAGLMCTGLHAYIRSNPTTCTYTVLPGYKVGLVTAQTYLRAEEWTDTTIVYKTLTIQIPGKLSVCTHHYRDQNTVTLHSMQQHNNERTTVTPDKIRTFSDLLPDDEVKALILHIMVIIRAKIPENNRDNDENYTSKCGIVSSVNCDILNYTLTPGYVYYSDTSINWLLPMYASKDRWTVGYEAVQCAILRLQFPNMNMLWSMYEVAIYYHIMSQLTNGDFVLFRQSGVSTWIYDYTLLPNAEITRLLNIPARNPNINLIPAISIHPLLKCYTSNINSFPQKTRDNHVKYMKYNTAPTTTTYVPLDAIVVEKNAIQFNIPTDVSDAADIFSEFLDETSIPAPNKAGQKVDIFTLSFVSISTTVETPNPEYEKFQQLLSPFIGEPDEHCTIESSSSGTASATTPADKEKKGEKEKENPFKTHIKTQQFNKLMQKGTPEPTICTITTKKRLECKSIGSGYKDVRNLFLREKDQTTFINVLSRFRDDKELMDELGVPNKVGIMLDGLPGTGKSTSILVMGSYLQKAIYYVDAAQIDTNDDLQAIYDYIPKNCPNGGILVFEDVDASCPVLLRRDNLQQEGSSGNIPLCVGDADDTTSEHSSTTSTKRSCDPDPTKTKTEKTVTLDKWLNLQQGFITPDGLLTAFSTNRGHLIDPAFTRKGRIDCRIQMRMCDRYQISRIFERFIRRPIDPNVLAAIEEDVYVPVDVIAQCVNYVHSTDTPDAEIMEPFVGAIR